MQSLRCLVTEGAVAVADEDLQPPSGEVPVLEAGDEVGFAVTVDVERRQANQNRARPERFRRQWRRRVVKVPAAVVQEHA